MDLLEELISKNLANHSELSEYKDVIINFIKEHKTKRPDICIEGCKSLIEGLCKFIFFNLNKEIANEKNWKDLNFTQKYQQTIKMLNLGNYESEFIERNSQLIHKLGEMRNERGDISHGQAYPKDSYANSDFAKFMISWTEGLCYFLLSSFFSIRQEQKEKEGVDIYTYDQFKEFDNYLDDLYPEVKLISYSKALKEQDSLQYELLMDNYYRK